MTVEAKVEEKVVVSLQPPKLWKVIFLNDDQTPMELVMGFLLTFSNIPRLEPKRSL